MSLSRIVLSSTLLLLAACTDSHTVAPVSVDHLDIVGQLETTLTGNIAAFWYPRSIDRDNGGYELEFGPRGEALNPGRKMIVSQARTVWFFSSLARAGYEKPSAFTKADLLSAADHGFRFLRDKMWDQEHGGFYFRVDPSGEEATEPMKHLYGQAFALYGLSEYYLASGNREALDLADQLFALLEAKAHDEEYGGYVEFFNADWTAAAPDTANYIDGVSPRVKLLNTHLHLMEALTTYYRAAPSPLVRERLVELIGIETNEVVRKDLVACTDKHQRDWTPILEPPYNRVSYGHDIENVWLVADACEAAGIDPTEHLQLYKDLWDYSLRYGYDDAAGGFYNSGPVAGPATDRDKVWWVQAEALVSALYMHDITGERRYREVFDQTWSFAKSQMIDWEHGDWHSTVEESGESTGNKGSEWKTAYHNGRAMMECIRLLREMEK
jgi:cellobiose epimerase